MIKRARSQDKGPIQWQIYEPVHAAKGTFAEKIFIFIIFDFISVDLRRSLILKLETIYFSKTKIRIRTALPKSKRRTASFQPAEAVKSGADMLLAVYGNGSYWSLT